MSLDESEAPQTMVDAGGKHVPTLIDPPTSCDWLAIDGQVEIPPHVTSPIAPRSQSDHGLPEGAKEMCGVWQPPGHAMTAKANFVVLKATRSPPHLRQDAHDGLGDVLQQVARLDGLAQHVASPQEKQGVPRE